MHIFYLKKKICLTQKLIKVTISQKLRIAHKKSFVQKMSALSIPIYPANLAIFKESWCFGSPVVGKRDMMWYEISRQPFFQLIAHILCQDGQFWLGMGGGGAVCQRQGLGFFFKRGDLVSQHLFNPANHFAWGFI